MSKFALVVSDVDGTLVTHDKLLTPRAIAAVGRLHEKGVAFSICSSRPPFGLRMLIEPLRLALPFGGYNGGSIVMPDLSVVDEKLIPAGAAERAVVLIEEHGIGAWVFADNLWLIRDPAGDNIDREIRTIATPPTVVGSFAPYLDRAAKIVGVSNDYDRVARYEAAGRAALAGAATVVRSQPYYCDVTPPGINKGRIVDLLAQRLGLSREQIAVLGDMENDLEMFARAGFGIAMGNAAPAVKARAQATTLSNDEDGFAAAIERYILAEG
jgi:Cof subfamily protein (haloacid dehalogenase superfamily)